MSILSGWMAALRERLRHLFLRGRMRRELDAELEFHFEQLTAKYVAEGMQRDQARRAARARLGGTDLVKERVADASGVRLLVDLLSDVRFAARLLRRKPTYAAVAIATLAIGSGAATTLFTVAHAVLVRPLPFESPERMFVLFGTHAGEDTVFGNVSLPTLDDWRRDSTSWSGIAGYAQARSTEFGGGGEPVIVEVGRVTEDFFDVLAMRAVTGRLPVAGEFNAESGLALISETSWRRVLGGTQQAVGKTVRIGNDSYQILGVVASAAMQLPSSATELWIPFARDVHRGSRSLNVIGRLEEGSPPAAAQQELDAINARLSSAFPETNGDRAARLIPMHEHFVGRSTGLLAIFLAASLLVFSVACVNTSNLLHVGSSERGAELAIRRALGAGRQRLIRLLLSEAAVIAVLGAAGGLLVTALAVPTIARIGAATLPRTPELAPGVVSVAAAAVLALIGALLVGLAPALRGTRTATRDIIDGISGRSTPGRAGDRMLVAEVAMTFVLVFGAALLLRSLWILSNVEPGVDATGVMTFRVDLPAGRYARGPEVFAFHQELARRLGAVDAVTAVGGINTLPFSGGTLSAAFAIDGAVPDDQSPSAQVRAVFFDYFESMGISLRSGRHFTAADRFDSVPVALVSEAMAHAAWEDADPEDRTVHIFGQERRVIGVVSDVRSLGLHRPPAPTVYVPFEQRPARGLTYTVAATDTDTALIAARAAVAEMDPQMPLREITTLHDLLRSSLDDSRGRAWLLAAMGSIALLLSMMGVYGLTAHLISGRRHEIGIRMAMGATSSSILRLAIARTARLVLLGIGVGCAGALAVGSAFRGLIHGLTPADPLTLLVAMVVLALAAAVGTLLPARRATQVNPVEALQPR